MRPAPFPNDDELGSREDSAVADPLSDRFQALWIGTAQKNRAIFSELFRTVPTNIIQNWEDYKVSLYLSRLDLAWVGVLKHEQTQGYVPKVKTGHLATEWDLAMVKSKLSQIHGHLVEAPLEFLIGQKELVENSDWQGLNPT
jgi:phospholipase D1/2